MVQALPGLQLPAQAAVMAGPSQGEPRYPQKQDQVEQEGSGSVLLQSTQYLPPVQRQGIDQEKERDSSEGPSHASVPKVSASMAEVSR